MTSPVLKLRAKDPEDVQVLSAILQDAIIPACDIIFNAAEKNFILVAQRLRREPHEGALSERICCALNIHGVVGVQTQQFDPADSERMLDLLAVLADQDSVTLVFADDAKIRLTLSQWTMFAEDFGEPWPASCAPCHDTPRQENAGQPTAGLDEPR